MSNPDTDPMPTNLLQSLCLVTGQQGGTIHQFDLSTLKWVCETKPDPRRNTEGHYSLTWTAPDGGQWALGMMGGASIEEVRQYAPIGPTMLSGAKGFWHQYPLGLNRIAWDQMWAREAQSLKGAKQ